MVKSHWGRAEDPREEYYLDASASKFVQSSNQVKMGFQSSERCKPRNSPIQSLAMCQRFSTAGESGFHRKFLTSRTLRHSTHADGQSSPERPRNDYFQSTHGLLVRYSTVRYGSLDQKIFTEVPKGAKDKLQDVNSKLQEEKCVSVISKASSGNEVVCHSHKALYGLKKTPRCWNHSF